MKKFILALAMVFLLACPASADIQATLEWSPNSEPDLAGYNVYRSETTGTGYQFINSVPVGTETFTDVSLEPNKTYYWVVTAFDNEIPENESGYSNEVSFETPDVPPTDGPPGAPSGLNVTVKVVIEIPPIP